MIVLDLETSGLDPLTHSILSIGAVEYDNPKNIFYGECTLREGAVVDLVALEINGFTLDHIKSTKKSCEQLLKEFLIWTETIKHKTIAGHNVWFDASFLREGFKFYHIKWAFRHRYVDLHSIFYFHCLKHSIPFPLNKGISGIDLDFIITYLHLKPREGVHNALSDAQLTCESFKILLQK